MGHQRKESQAHHEVKASMEWRAVVQECWSLLHLHLGFGYVCKGLEGTSADKCVPFHVCFTPSLLMIVSVIHKHRHIYMLSKEPHQACFLYATDEVTQKMIDKMVHSFTNGNFGEFMIHFWCCWFWRESVVSFWLTFLLLLPLLLFLSENWSWN